MHRLHRRFAQLVVAALTLGLGLAVAGGDARPTAAQREAHGGVWAWGLNHFGGQLGQDPARVSNSAVPGEVAGLTDVTAVEAGSYHSLALQRGGTVWAWGDNRYGLLGNGGSGVDTCPTPGGGVCSPTPVRVSGLDGVSAIAAGNVHSLALKQDGTVWAWGRNDYGQVGTSGTGFCPSPVPTTCSLTPVQVSGLTGVVAIAAGYQHSLALQRDGTVWAWGDNRDGELGNGTTKDGANPLPARVEGISEMIAVAGGGKHSLALRKDGTVWAWGLNQQGQLGSGTTGPAAYVIVSPVQVRDLTRVVAIAAGKVHSLALKQDGTVWTWGDNGYAQLGTATTSTCSPANLSCSAVPVQVAGLAQIRTIAAGDLHSLAVRPNGTVFSWGDNRFGQLGDGTTTTRVAPVRVDGLKGVQAIAGGVYHSLAAGK